MTTLTAESAESVTKLINKALASARYLVDTKGNKTDVVLSLSVWQQLLTLLEDLDDRIIIQEWLPRLQAGPTSSGVLRWDDVVADWEDDTKV